MLVPAQRDSLKLLSNLNRGWRLAVAALATVLIALVAISPAEARPNLPQRAAPVALSPDQRAKLDTVIAALPLGGPVTLSPEASELLVGLLPGDFQASCAGMLDTWGEEAKGTARWGARVLYSSRDSGRFTALLAYRCDSQAAGYADFYDERLAALDLAPNGGDLRLIPMAEDCANCSELYHLDFSQGFSVENGKLVELRLVSSTDNPCCDSSSRELVEQLVFILLPEARAVLQFDRSRERYDHDDQAGDTERMCRAEIRYAHDPSGRLLSTVAESSCRENGKKLPSKTESYRWDSISRRFQKQPAGQR